MGPENKFDFTSEVADDLPVKGVPWVDFRDTGIYGRVPGWPFKRKRGANKFTGSLAKKDVVAGLVRSACLGSYHNRRK